MYDAACVGWGALIAGQWSIDCRVIRLNSIGWRGQNYLPIALTVRPNSRSLFRHYTVNPKSVRTISHREPIPHSIEEIGFIDVECRVQPGISDILPGRFLTLANTTSVKACADSMLLVGIAVWVWIAAFTATRRR